MSEQTVTGRKLVVDFLVRHFVRDYEKVDDGRVRERYGMLSSVVGILCNVIIFSSKLVIGTLVHSIAIVSDGFNNMSDCASCIVTMFGYKMAAKPADKDHPFGHGRMEYLTSLVIAAVIVVVGCELLKSSVTKIVHPEAVTFSVAALVILIISILIKIWMGFFNKRLGTRIRSSVMLATAQDSFSDVFATLATLIALVASLWTDAPVDGVMGVLVSALILVSGFGIIRDTVDQLLGKPADEEIVKKLKEMVEESTVALGMHDLIIHSYGPGNLIGSVHIEVDAANPILDIHDAIDELERNIYDELHIRMTIHMDPIEVGNTEIAEYKRMMTEIVTAIDEKLSIHDFRVVSGPTHTNFVFDLLISYDCQLTEEYIRGQIDRKLEQYDRRYYAVITFDKSYY